MSSSIITDEARARMACPEHILSLAQMRARLAADQEIIAALGKSRADSEWDDVTVAFAADADHPRRRKSDKVEV